MNYINRCILLSVFLLSCCSANEEKPPSMPSGWDDIHGLFGLGERIDAVASSETKDCGFFDLIRSDATDPQLIRKWDCVSNLSLNTTPFKFGSLRLPIDSYVYEVVVRDNVGQYHMFTLDLSADVTSAQLWVERCSRVEFNDEILGYSRENCVDIESQSWGE